MDELAEIREELRYEPDAGEHIQGAVEKTVEMAQREGRVVTCTFNDVVLTAHPDSTPVALLLQFDRAIVERQEGQEYQERQRARDREERIRQQERARCVAILKEMAQDAAQRGQDRALLEAAAIKIQAVSQPR